MFIHHWSAVNNQQRTTLIISLNIVFIRLWKTSHEAIHASFEYQSFSFLFFFFSPIPNTLRSHAQQVICSFVTRCNPIPREQKLNITRCVVVWRQMSTLSKALLLFLNVTFHPTIMSNLLPGILTWSLSFTMWTNCNHNISLSKGSNTPTRKSLQVKQKAVPRYCDSPAEPAPTTKSWDFASW